MTSDSTLAPPPAARPDAPDAGDVVGLTPREREVVVLVAQGLSNREICERLYLAENTLKSYIRSAYRRMAVRTRAQAVNWAFTHALPELAAPGLPQTVTG